VINSVPIMSNQLDSNRIEMDDRTIGGDSIISALYLQGVNSLSTGLISELLFVHNKPDFLRKGGPTPDFAERLVH